MEITDEMRTAVNVELARRNMNQGDLAQQIGVKPQALNRALNRATAGRTLWPEILKALDLTLTLTPEDRK